MSKSHNILIHSHIWGYITIYGVKVNPFLFLVKAYVLMVSKQHLKLGDRIRKIIEDSSVSQRELARRLGVGPNQVSRWVLGTVAPTYTVLNDILKICRKTQEAGWLLSGKGEGESTNKNQHDGNTNDEAETEEEMIYRKKYEALMEKHIAMMEEISSLKDSLLEKPQPLFTKKN